jgi:dipeptidyl aminopeptidase/acylaminoacyl peptidase
MLEVIDALGPITTPFALNALTSAEFLVVILYSNVLTKFSKFIPSCFFLILFSACAWEPVGESKQASATAAVSATPTPATPQIQSKPGPYVAYLHEGNLWAMRADGTNLRQIAAAPPGETIQDYLWSLDGQRIYYAVGTRFYDVAIETGNLASGGELTAPAGVTIDRLELGRDGRTLLVHALDADSQPRVYGVTVGEREARELAVDEYNALAPSAAPIIRQVGEMSVSPDAQYVLFKEIVGTGEELFVAEVETGRKWQVSNLSVLYGFEPSAEAMGGRTILEATWSPDGRYIIFNPSQSCSDVGLCYGRLFLVDRWGGAQLQLSIDMMISLPLEWNRPTTLLAYDDGSEIVVSDTSGQTKRLADGNRPKWQPLAE